MPRFTHRRAIVFLVLLCQLLAVSVVHVPMAKAAQAPPIGATSAHCHDDAATASSHIHGTPNGVLAAVTHAMPSTGDTPSDAGHHCKSGFCVCVCAHAPAGPAVAAAISLPQISRPPLLAIDSVHSAPERAAVFFRPPI